jgi:hypothetical protein
MKTGYVIFIIIGFVGGCIHIVQGNDIYGAMGYLFAYISKIGYDQCKIIKIQSDTLEIIKDVANLRK